MFCADARTINTTVNNYVQFNAICITQLYILLISENGVIGILKVSRIFTAHFYYSLYIITLFSTPKMINDKCDGLINFIYQQSLLRINDEFDAAPIQSFISSRFSNTGRLTFSPSSVQSPSFAFANIPRVAAFRRPCTLRRPLHPLSFSRSIVDLASPSGVAPTRQDTRGTPGGSDG